MNSDSNPRCSPTRRNPRSAVPTVGGWAEMIEAGEKLAPIVRPALEDACGVLTETGRTEDAAYSEAALARAGR